MRVHGASQAKGQEITRDEQLAKWLGGESIHRASTFELTHANGDVTELTGGECTPDFSCCQPELLASEETRRAFVSATEKERVEFLGVFLGAAFELAAKKRGGEPPKVYIAGKAPDSEN